MNPYIWSGLFASIANLSIGWLVLFKDRGNKINRLFFLLSLSIAGWCLGSFLENIISNKALALYILRVNYFFGVWTPPLYLHFIYALAGDAEKRQGIRYLYWASAFFALMIFTPWFIPNIQTIAMGFRISYPGFIYYAFFCFFAFSMLRVIAFTFTQLRKKISATNTMFQLVATANCLAILAGFEYFSRVFGLFNSPPLDDFILVLYVLILTVAIIRHKLFDVAAIAEIVQEARLAALGMMAASLNHELRNPLYVAKGRLETQLDAIDRKIFPTAIEEAEQSKAVIQSSLHHIDRAMDIVIRFTDMMKGRSAEALRENVILTDVVTDVLALAASELKVKDIYCSHSISGDISLFIVRRDLEEVLFNLLVNACHALKQKPKDRQIELAAEVKDEKVIIKIKDNGHGIPAGAQDKLFSPFYTTKEEGTGLGLFIVKLLTERNRGKITCQSQPGSGTEFRLEFSQSREHA